MNYSKYTVKIESFYKQITLYMAPMILYRENRRNDELKIEII